MNILFIKYFFVGCMVSEIPRVSVFGHCPYSVTVRIRLLFPIYRKNSSFHIFIQFLISSRVFCRRRLLSLNLIENDYLLSYANRELLIELLIILGISFI